MTLEAWEKDMTVEMLPDGIHRAIAEEIGIENLLKLASVVGGTTLYIQTKERLLVPLRDRRICREYNGYNAVQLGQKYHLTSKRIWQIAKGK